MKDWLGKEYGVGDLILYAAMSGRCVTMVLGKVLRIYQGPQYGYSQYREEDPDYQTETKVQVQPLKASRWKQHGRTRFIDTRTGKGIDAYLIEKNGFYRHQNGGYFEDTQTGERVPRSVYDERFRRWRYWDADSKLPPGWKYIPATYKDYVKQETAVSPVTISVTENIVKWTGDTDDL